MAEKTVNINGEDLTFDIGVSQWLQDEDLLKFAYEKRKSIQEGIVWSDIGEPFYPQIDFYGVARVRLMDMWCDAYNFMGGDLDLDTLKVELWYFYKANDLMVIELLPKRGGIEDL